jgi:hypothetical protein
MLEARGSYIRDDDPAIVGTSPTRKEYQREAAAQARVLGKKRIQTKYSNAKAVLEVGDYVSMKVSHKYKTSHGDKVILGTVHEKLPHKKYLVLTHAGVLTKKFPRNELTFDPQFDADHLSIPPAIAELLRISEGDALSIINPMRRTAVFCKCKKVLCPCPITHEFLPACHLHPSCLVTRTTLFSFAACRRKLPDTQVPMQIGRAVMQVKMPFRLQWCARCTVPQHNATG